MSILDHTPHTEKKTTKPIVASQAINIMHGANCRFVEPRNGPTLHEHVIQGPQSALGVVLSILTHLSTPMIRNYLLVGTFLPYGQHDPTPWVSIPSKLHMSIDMP